MFHIVAQKVAAAVFALNDCFSKQPKSHQEFGLLLKENVVAQNISKVTQFGHNVCRRRYLNNLFFPFLRLFDFIFVMGQFFIFVQPFFYPDSCSQSGLSSREREREREREGEKGWKDKERDRRNIPLKNVLKLYCK